MSLWSTPRFREGGFLRPWPVWYELAVAPLARLCVAPYRPLVPVVRLALGATPGVAVVPAVVLAVGTPLPVPSPAWVRRLAVRAFGPFANPSFGTARKPPNAVAAW